MAKRKRRAFTREFKAEAVRLVRERGKSVPTVARELDLTETALRSWVRQAEIDARRGKAGALPASSPHGPCAPPGGVTSGSVSPSAAAGLPNNVAESNTGNYWDRP